MEFGFLSEDLRFFCKIANTRLFVKSWGTEGVGPLNLKFGGTSIYSFSRLAVKQSTYKLGGLKQQFILSQIEGWKSKVKVPAGPCSL